MRIQELLEGGWASTVTQKTVITPKVVEQAIRVISKFMKAFNAWNKDMPPVQVGHPTGSSAYYKIDPPDKVYGDIDLQVIVPEIPSKEDMTSGQLQYFWYKKFDEFIAATKPNYVHHESQSGHPIVKIGASDYAQVDLMPHPKKFANWGRFRTTPEHNVKGLLYGYMYSVLSTLLNLSIQSSGVQYREKDGVRVVYTTSKDKPKTISLDIGNFIKDLFNYEYKRLTGKDPSTARVDPLLNQYPGINTEQVKIGDFVNGIKGMARSFEANGMFGKDILAPYSNADDFLNKFVSNYEAKAINATKAKKMDKAETPEAKARAEADRKKITDGLAMVKKLFANNN
jgi:hypothetical protein